MIKIEPRGDMVLLEPLSAENISTGGLIIPETAQEKQQKGIVIACGPGKKGVDMGIEPGQTVLFSKYSGIEVLIEGKPMLMMKEDFIYAIIKDEPKNTTV